MDLEVTELTTMRITHVNPRTEEHGDALVPALDVRLEWETTSAVLDRFHPELRGALYWANEEARSQPNIDGVEAISGNLIFPDLDALRWKGKPEALYTLAIELPSLAPVILAGCKLGGLVLDAKEGGTVVVSFRLQCSPVGEREAGKLSTMIGARVLATLRQAVDPEPGDAPVLADAPDLHAWPFGASAPPESAKPQTRKGWRRTNMLEREAQAQERDATETFLAASETYIAGTNGEDRGDEAQQDTTGH